MNWLLEVRDTQSWWVVWMLSGKAGKCLA